MAFLIKSSNYNICMTNAALITTYYVYNIDTYISYYIAFGVVFFNFFEYIYHRFLLHITNDGLFYHYIHGNHHLKPHGKSIHFPVIFIAGVNILMYYPMSFYIEKNYLMNIGLGSSIAYILFENIHKEIHHPYWFPANNIMREYHMYHHTKSKYMAYGFSVPTWDILFGTYPLEIAPYNPIALIPIPFVSFFLGIDRDF